MKLLPSYWLLVFAQDKSVRANEGTSAQWDSSFGYILLGAHLASKPQGTPAFSEGGQQALYCLGALCCSRVYVGQMAGAPRAPSP